MITATRNCRPASRRAEGYRAAGRQAAPYVALSLAYGFVVAAVLVL